MPGLLEGVNQGLTFVRSAVAEVVIDDVRLSPALRHGVKGHAQRGGAAPRGTRQLDGERLRWLRRRLFFDEGGDCRERDQRLRLEDLALDRVYLLVYVLDPGLHVQGRVDVRGLA